MSKRIAINGFGRIGRLAFRNLLKNEDLEVVAINDLTNPEILAHLLKYDTAQGPFEGQVELTDPAFFPPPRANGLLKGIYSPQPLKGIYSPAPSGNPEDLPWKELNVDIVLECTGIFRTKEAAAKHITAGAQKVIISAPAKGDGVQTIVLGINDNELDMANDVFSNASCTTNCLAPVMKILEEK